MKTNAPSTWQTYRILLAKDLRHEMRTRDLLTSMGLYAVLILIVFGAAFAQVGDKVDIQRMAAGLVWTTLVFTSLLGLSRSFAYEEEAGALEGVLLTPADRSCIYLAKLTANLIFLLVVEVVVLPLFYFLFLTATTPTDSFAFSLLPLFLGTFGISSVGTLLASITANARGKEVLLAILFIPVIFPLLYAVVAASTGAVVASIGWELVFRNSCILAGAYDIIMTLASWLLYDYVIGS